MKTFDSNQQSIIDPLNSTVPRNTQILHNADTIPRIKNEQIRSQQIKQQIEEELRNNKALVDDIERRMDSIRHDVMRKEQAIAMEEEKVNALIQEKQIIDMDQQSSKAQLEQLQISYGRRSQDVMQDYIKKNKHVLALENEYQREMINLRQDNNIQSQDAHHHWNPRMQSVQSHYDQLLKINEQMNQKSINFREMFLRMRLEHDENLRFMEQKYYQQEKERYLQQIEILQKKEAQYFQDLSQEENKRDEVIDDFMRLESKLNQEKSYLIGEIQLERESIHKAHEEMSNCNILIEQYRNENLVLDGHTNKLKRKIQETNRILLQTKDQGMKDTQYQRLNHEHRFNQGKQGQYFLHQRVIEMELMLRNSLSENTKVKNEYEKLRSILQSRVSQAVADACKFEIRR